MRYLRPVLIVAICAGALWLAFVVQKSPTIQLMLLESGYLGVFFFSFINGFNIIVPVVTASFVPALVTAGLNPYILVGLISLGMTFADTIVFFLARAGRIHLSLYENTLMRTLFAAEERNHWLPLVLLALWVIFVPIPGEVMLVPLGLLGYAPRRVIPVVFMGNIIFNTLIAFGALGILGLAGI